MKRPNKEDYTFLCEHTVLTKLSRYYVPELEAYCDELEKELKFIAEVQTPSYEKTQEELWKYQKALDKACYWLENSIPTEALEWDKDKWKEMLLKDE